jgi:hypothetical protein
VKKEYDSFNFSIKYLYSTYRDDIINSYKLGEKFGLHEIIDIGEEVIKSKMPIYTKVDVIDMDKLRKLIDYMSENRVYHNDLAARNIYSDSEGNYKLINLSSLSDDDFWKISRDGDKIDFGNNYYLRKDYEP